jgi:2-keto-4-pentenoate hydratase/2-oxohepta-3-ene-1,7-dioic acid hydratase in catechol pathway
MRLVTYRTGSEERLGALVSDDRILDLEAAGERLGQAIPSSMQALIEAGNRTWDIARDLIQRAPEEALVAVGAARLLAPLPRPIRLRDCVLFVEHTARGLASMGKHVSEQYYRQVIYFNADHTHVSGPEDEVRWPRHSRFIDYELEIACVIGRTVLNATPETAADAIFGYTIFNDWSARDVQMKFMDAGQGPCEGKDFDNTLGPCIVTADEIEDPYALSMTARVNGEVWSEGSTASMTHRFDKPIVQFSRDRTLLAGEVLGSGAVLNGSAAEQGKRLTLGDVVELEIEGIGVLRNRVVSA